MSSAEFGEMLGWKEESRLNRTQLYDNRPKGRLGRLGVVPATTLDWADNGAMYRVKN